ncbi:uncharacterized protein LOC127875258 [Dreissena polymorpha]|uniref:Methyltransferase domain-containing protein n=1 Tax=Dreissena polymorpha TaxID=45954 RepID=A0A9D4L7C6_DREPO|nr:uncharacterized protein LOC127875258 [Dreissena polymorpha]KAH3853372.1 hypothetical protein DPMN_095894 [Dreissena polymorpha]
MDFQQSVAAFKTILTSINHDILESFLLWTKDYVNDALREQERKDNANVILDSIREDIRNDLPLTASSPSEQFVKPSAGQNADCDTSSTVHIDAFLYEEDDVDDLVERGLLSRNYCVHCLSRQVKPLTFISHSASVPQIKFIFQYLLGDLRHRTVVDVGSRTGAILYGAYLYSEAPNILGIEIDPNFCQLQQNIIDKYGMKNRIKVLFSDVLDQAEMINSADVIVLNNVFEFFSSVEVQLRIWQFLFETVRKKDTVLVTVPSIEESLSNIDAAIDVQTWVEPVNVDNVRKSAVLKYFPDEDSSDLDDIFMYRVK